jgi:hypothetical protein
MYAVAWVIIDPSRTGQISSSEECAQDLFREAPESFIGLRSGDGIGLPARGADPARSPLEESGCLSRMTAMSFDSVKKFPII